MIESDLQRAYNYPIYPNKSKIYSDKGFETFEMAPREEAIGPVFVKKLTTLFTSIVLEELQMNFYSTNYLNQYVIIILKLKIYILHFVDLRVYIFST